MTGQAAVTGIRCFLLEPTDRALSFLRRHARAAGVTCSVTGFPYHEAEVDIGEGVVAAGDGGAIVAGDWPHDDRRWPRACACGYAFGPEDEWRLAVARLWRRLDTREEFPLRDAPGGPCGLPTGSGSGDPMGTRSS